MGDSSNKTTQTQTNEPYSAAKPLLNTAMGDAQSLYKSGGLVKPNTMSTVVPYAQQTTAGMNSIQNTAQGAMAPGGFTEQFKSIIGNGGFNDPQMDAVDNTRSLANSSYDMNANPGFADVLKQAQEGSMYGSNANAQAMGRYGSGTHQGVQQRELGNLTSRMVGDDYNRWLGRRDGANTQLFGMGQTGMDNMNPAYASLKAPAEDLMGVGSMYEDLMGRTMNDQLRITNEKQNAPMANIQALLAAAAGSGSYGQQTGTAQGPNSTMSNVLGGGLGLLSLL
jgi:hypothetical protein